MRNQWGLLLCKSLGLVDLGIAGISHLLNFEPARKTPVLKSALEVKYQLKLANIWGKVNNSQLVTVNHLKITGPSLAETKAFKT